MVDTLNLTDMKATGRMLTWTNGHVWSKIDRALCNTAWNLTYGRITTDFKENNFSDHSPILLAFSLDEARKRRPFRFLNVLTADERFLGIIDEVWKQPTQGSFMFQVWQKLTKCKEPLKVLMQAEMGNLEHKIQEARDRVQAIQIQLTNHIDETLLARANANNISTLRNVQGRTLLKHSDIEEEILTFYKGLLGTAAPTHLCVDITIMRHRPCLNVQQQKEMIAAISQTEIQEALFAIDDNKAPCIDGFNAHFFKKTWGIIKGDVTLAIRVLFREYSAEDSIGMTKKAATPMRNTGIEPECAIPNFSLGISQHETAIAGSYAENRSKRINDPRCSKEYAGDNVVNVRGKKIAKAKRNVDEDDDEEVSKFLVTKHPAVAPSMCRYTNVNVMQDIRGKLTDPQMDMFRNSCFGKYLRMQQLDVQAQIFRCFMVKELRGSTYRCFTFEINGKVLRFGLREFALITGLDCVSDENDFVYDNSKPNRLMVEYFGRNQENQLPVKRHELIECFNKTVWDDKGDDAVKMTILFEEVVPTPHELETLKLPPVAHDIPDVKHGVDGVHGTDLVDDDYDNFSTTPPHLSSGKQQQRSANSDSPRGKKRTQFPVSVPPSRKQPSRKESGIKGTRKPDAPTAPRTDEFKLIREEIRIFKKEVFDYMDNNFKKLLDAIKGNQTPDKVGDTMLKADLHSDGGISQGNQSGGAVKLSTKENQGGGATSAQRSHPVVEGVGLPINDPVSVVDVDKET
ncbi:uncharacterized protein LOC132624503 [Lycium barbarum]|uniref:uncharacterized protein LOC132624503 n=1 Tax=Lycium barbarum TaxID=112863 RepID=UPI00293E4F3D|nr:uncharacterized protein LOC132624503 [Lycium barbarum]